MGSMDGVFNGFRNYLRTTPKNKLYIHLFVLVAVVGGSIIGLSFIQKESYSTLFSGLSTEDASMIVSRLKELKVPYKLGVGGTSVHVPKEKVHDVRLLLAGQNSLPGSGGMGFELFDKTNYGMTEFMQNINYKRAVQGELSRTINQMPEVKASRVHIAIPEKSLFADREREVTASVFLKLKQGRNLAKEQVAGVVHLVAGSIEGLRPENITVVDSFGKILYKNSSAGSSIALSGQHFELQKNVERTIEESVQSMLDKFIQSSRSIVRASVELNLRKVEKVEEEYLPNKTVVTSERKSKEKTVNRSEGRIGGGVPGVASNVPNVGKKGDAKADGQSGRSNESEREEAQTSYEVSKTVSKIIEPYGDIRKISLAIVVDGKYEKVKGQKGEELKYVPRSQKEIDNIKNVIARAVGYNEGRGDKIEVLNVPFETESFADERALIEKAERKDLIMSVSKYFVYLIMLVAIFLFVVKPFLGILKRREETLPLQQIRDVYVKNSNAAGTEAIEDKATAALANVMKDKALVGSIIREWVKEGT